MKQRLVNNDLGAKSGLWFVFIQVLLQHSFIRILGITASVIIRMEWNS